MYKNKKYRSGTGIVSSATRSNIESAALAEGPEEKRSKPTLEYEEQNENEDPFQSQESILPSQGPTQRRYFSQRSNFGGTQANRTIKRIPSSYYEIVLMKCGVDLDYNESIMLDADHITFVNKLRHFLEINPEYPENVQRFLNGLRDALKDENNMIKLFSGCLIIMQSPETTIQSQESLVKDFLMIDFMQNDLIDIFTEKMKYYAVKDVSEMEVPIVSLILSQLKFIDYVANGEKLFKNIFDVLSIANENVQADIIRCMEDVLDLSLHDKAVRKLMEMFPNNEELLTAVNIDTFGNMRLSCTLKSELQTKIINFIKNSEAHLSIFPSLIKFILIFDENDLDSIPNLIHILRECLDWTSFENADKCEINISKIEIFEFLKNSLICSKKLFDKWFKWIQNNNEADDQKPIDLMILILMISINDDKILPITNLLKRKIKLQVFTQSLLKETIEEYSVVFAPYLKHFLELVDNFLKDRDNLLVEFGYSSYRLSFGISNCDKSLLISKLLRFVCVKQGNSFPGRETVDITSNSLRLMINLCVDYPNDLADNSTRLMKLWDRIPELNMVQYRLLMELFCMVAYPPAPQTINDFFEDNLNMLVRKQLASNLILTKCRGVVGVVRILNHLSGLNTSEQLSPNNSNNPDLSIESVSNLPTERAKDAANWIELILTSTSNSVQGLGMCFDELGAVFSFRNKTYNNESKHIDREFLNWMCYRMTQCLYSKFLVDEMPTIDGIEMSYQCCLNLQEENKNSTNDVLGVALNIGKHCTSEQSVDALSSLVILPSLFKLIRVLQFRRHYGNLTGINALPGIAFILPKFMETESGIFEYIEVNNDIITTTKVIDIHFYLANWYREIISAFSSQDDKMVRNKVLTRLTQLIALETRIKAILRVAPSNYKPPNCVFDLNVIVDEKFKKPTVPVGATQSTSKKGNKRGRPTLNITDNLNQSADTEAISTIAATMRTQNVSVISALEKFGRAGQKFNLYYGPKEIYRSLDPDIMLLLKEKFVISDTLGSDTIGKRIGLLELKFILTDLVQKIESLSGLKCGFGSSFPPADMMSDLVQFLPKILECIEQFQDYIKTINGSDPNDMFNDKSNYMKICYGLCLRLITAIYTWPDIKNHTCILEKSLRTIIGDTSTSQEFSTTELASLALQKIFTYENSIQDLQSAVYLFNLASAISIFVNKENEIELIVKLCSKFLSNRWFAFEGGEEKGAQCNVLLDKLLKGYFKHAKLPMILSNVKWVLVEIIYLKKKSGSLRKFPLLHKANFPLLYRALCSALVTAISNKVSSGITTVAHFAPWERGCEILNNLLEIVRIVDIPRNFVFFLKHAQLFIKLFLQYGMPLMEISLSRNAERANELLKSLQQTTRFLHNLCCYSKVIKNTAIVTQIPCLRQTIEKLVFRVKAALAANNCSSVFWMGNLKNKDLRGDEILSQVSSINSQQSDNNEEELPEEETDLAEDLGIEDDTSLHADSMSSTNSSRSKCV